jgi:glutathione S-transferase
MVYVDLLKNETKTPAFSKINPLQGIPVVIIDDSILIESSAILDFLESRYSDTPLLPQDPIKRAQIRGFC